MGCLPAPSDVYAAMAWPPELRMGVTVYLHVGEEDGGDPDQTALVHVVLGYTGVAEQFCQCGGARYFGATWCAGSSSSTVHAPCSLEECEDRIAMAWMRPDTLMSTGVEGMRSKGMLASWLWALELGRRLDLVQDSDIQPPCYSCVHENAEACDELTHAHEAAVDKHFMRQVLNNPDANVAMLEEAVVRYFFCRVIPRNWKRGNLAIEAEDDMGRVNLCMPEARC
eukprot:3205774-Amphidinium_carterae.1